MMAEYCDVTVMVSRRKLLPAQKRYKIGKVEVIEQNGPFLPNTSEKRLTKWSRNYEKMYERINAEKPIDVIHCHDYIALYPARQLHRKHQIPYITTIHNTDFIFGKVSEWRNTYLEDALSKSHAVIAVGKSLATALEAYVGKDQIRVIPNIIDTERFAISVSMPTAPFRFLFVGNYEPRKRVMTIIEAFSKMENKDATLTLYGYGTQKSEMEKLVEDQDLSSKVVINDTLPNDQLPSVYQSHHCYISASTAETFGITVAEAMSCGLHIIYNRSGGPEHFVSDIGSLLVDPIDVDSLAKAMDAMITQYDHTLAPRIRKHAIDQFSSEKVITQILELYQQSTAKN